MYTATFLKVTRFFRSIICQKTNHEEEGTTAFKESVCVVVQRVKYYDKKNELLPLVILVHNLSRYFIIWQRERETQQERD